MRVEPLSCERRCIELLSTHQMPLSSNVHRNAISQNFTKKNTLQHYVASTCALLHSHAGRLPAAATSRLTTKSSFPYCGHMWRACGLSALPSLCKPRALQADIFCCESTIVRNGLVRRLITLLFALCALVACSLPLSASKSVVDRRLMDVAEGEILNAMLLILLRQSLSSYPVLTSHLYCVSEWLSEWLYVFIHQLPILQPSNLWTLILCNA